MTVPKVSARGMDTTTLTFNKEPQKCGTIDAIKISHSEKALIEADVRISRVLVIKD